MTLRIWAPDGPEAEPFYNDVTELYEWEWQITKLWLQGLDQDALTKYFNVWDEEGTVLLLPLEVDE